MVASPAELERRLDAGEELTPGEVAALLGLSRTTVHEMIRAGKIGFTKTPGGHRRCHVEDVRRELAMRREVHRGDPAAEKLRRKNRGETG